MSSASRPLLVIDAALALRTIRRRSGRRYIQAAAGMQEQRDIALALDSERRLPATHPIDPRWDQSRFVHLESARRNSGQAHTWSPRNGIVFAKDQSTPRADATRSSLLHHGQSVYGSEQGDDGGARNKVSQDASPRNRALAAEVSTSNSSLGASRNDRLLRASDPPAVRHVRRNTHSEKPGATRRAISTSPSMIFGNAYSTVARMKEDTEEADSEEGETRMTSDDQLSIDSVSFSDEFSEKSLSSDDDYKPSQDSQCYESAREPDLTSISTGLELPDISRLRVTEAPSFRRLTYHIPPEQYRNAVLSSQRTMASFWSHKLYRSREGKMPLVLYCRSFDKAEEVAKKFVNEDVLGFDLEWEQQPDNNKNNIKQKCSLIQLAAESQIALFHVAIFNGETAETLMPPSLKAILESRDILKVGVNIGGDATRVNAHLESKMQGVFELSHLYRVVHFSEDRPSEVNKKPWALARQVEGVFGLPLAKGPVRLSHWSRHLTTEQTDYAATDAYAGLMLFHALETKRKEMNPTPPRPRLYEDHQPLLDGHGRMFSVRDAVSKVNKRKREHINTAANDPAFDEGEDDEENEFEDALEEQEDHNDDVDPPESDPSTASSQRSELARYTLNLDLGGGPAEEPQMSQTVHEHDDSYEADSRKDSVSAQPTKPIKRGPIPGSSEVTQANTWVTSWRSSLPDAYDVKASDGQLRAYHLWHEQRLDCGSVAALLRDPPLKMQTVAGYVLDAIKLEHLAFESERLAELLVELHPSAHSRYGKVLARMHAIE